METEQYLKELTKQLWHAYLLEPTEEHFEEIVKTCSNVFTMVGTGRHEIYRSIGELAESLAQNQREAQQIRFDMIDEWYEVQRIRQDVALVFGGVWVREHREKVNESLVEMDTRFSVLYAKDEEGNWKIKHLHHSMPYFDQRQNEYYPKALSTKVREALDLVELFKKRSELDLMTGVYNHDSFQCQAKTLLRKEGDCHIYVLDLDNFKQVNDTCGHGVGDSLLKLMAEVLQKQFQRDSAVGRIGGDEFAICEYGASSRAACAEKLAAVRRNFKREAAKLVGERPVGFSVGIAWKARDVSTYQDIFQRADEALYLAKRSEKGAFVWYPEKTEQEL